jgi:hypothetical protein
MSVVWLHEDKSSNKKIHNLYSSQNIIKFTKSGSMGWVENITCAEEKRNSCRV